MVSGNFIFVDPDDELVEFVDVIELTVDALCDLLRCDATDLVELPIGLYGYVDGEGAWQGRQQEWELQEISFWGPMLIFKGMDEFGYPISCEEEDIDQVLEAIHFFNV